MLKRKLQEDQPNVLGPLTAEETAATEELQDRLISPLVLALPYTNEHFLLDTDACSGPVGFVLLQKQPVIITKPVGY